MDWLTIAAGALMVFGGAWHTPRSAAKIRARLVERGGDTTKWDSSMVPLLRVTNPLMIVIGVGVILLGVFDLPAPNPVTEDRSTTWVVESSLTGRRRAS